MRARQDDRLGQAPGGEQDALATQDDELDRHAAMLPLVRLIERAAALGAHARAAHLACASKCWDRSV